MPVQALPRVRAPDRGGWWHRPAGAPACLPALPSCLPACLPSCLPPFLQHTTCTHPSPCCLPLLLQLLGLGRTGHIGFNERGSSRSSTTRLVTLDRWRAPCRLPSAAATGASCCRHQCAHSASLSTAPCQTVQEESTAVTCCCCAACTCRVTRVDAAADFFGEAAVPRRAITMGVGTIMKAGACRPGWLIS